MAKKLWSKIYPFEGDIYREDITPNDEGFAPSDPHDGRPVGEWRSRYPEEVHRHIVGEAAYLAIQGLLLIIVAALGWMMAKGLVQSGWSNAVDEAAKWLGFGFVAFAGGAIGGTLFGLKWLYHGVAKGIWSLDRRLWRLFTPWISGLLAVIVVALIAGDLLRIFRPDSMSQPSTVFGVSALVGLFSDMTLGKLAELAKVLFGKGAEEKGVSRGKNASSNARS